jgi:hypothetical protein
MAHERRSVRSRGFAAKEEGGWKVSRAPTRLSSYTGRKKGRLTSSARSDRKSEQRPVSSSLVDVGMMATERNAARSPSIPLSCSDVGSVLTHVLRKHARIPSVQRLSQEVLLQRSHPVGSVRQGDVPAARREEEYRGFSSIFGFASCVPIGIGHAE